MQKFEDLPEEDLKKIMNQAKDMVEANLKTGKLSTSFTKGMNWLVQWNGLIQLVSRN